jgi:uncharacterized protein (TIGR02300 family)
MLLLSGDAEAVKAFDTLDLLWQLARTVDKTQDLKGIFMPKEEWGVKRVCPTTGKRFYDLNNSPIVSPYTGEVVEFDTGKNRMIAADAEDAATKKMKASKLETDEDVLDEDEVDVDVDDDLLDDDEDDNVSLDELADVAADDDDL